MDARLSSARRAAYVGCDVVTGLATAEIVSVDTCPATTTSRQWPAKTIQQAHRRILTTRRFAYDCHILLSQCLKTTHVSRISIIKSINRGCLSSRATSRLMMVVSAYMAFAFVFGFIQINWWWWWWWWSISNCRFRWWCPDMTFRRARFWDVGRTLA